MLNNEKVFCGSLWAYHVEICGIHIYIYTYMYLNLYIYIHIYIYIYISTDPSESRGSVSQKKCRSGTAASRGPPSAVCSLLVGSIPVLPRLLQPSGRPAPSFGHVPGWVQKATLGSSLALNVSRRPWPPFATQHPAPPAFKFARASQSD